MTQVEDLAAALEELTADPELGTSDIATILVDQGWTKMPTTEKKIGPGSFVEVLFRGDWVPGHVTGVGPGGLLDISHERGAISAYIKGSNVRLPQKK